MKSGVQILDCTIRDGSYVVDYQFTVEDTYLVAAGLAGAGIRHIEVGHGLGLNAQRCGKGNAAITDLDYIRSARSAAPQAKIGSFFIPGIGTADSLRAAAEAGLGLVRVGIDVDDFAKLESYVRLGKSLGLEVWGNLMKSYIVPPQEFAEVCRRVGEFGADVVALVDSAGGMTPNDVAAYTSAAVQKTSVPLAFHGHNNLSLAVANCLRFVEAGGTFVDGTLSGMGRSGGNAATELLAVLLGDKLATPLDWKRLTEFADAMMEFCVPDHARPRAVEIATGVNFFHSSFREKIVAPAAAEAHASLFRTILNLPQTSRKTVTPAVAAEAARAAAAEPRAQVKLGALPGQGDPLERLQPRSLEKLADRLRVQKGKSGQRRVITVARSADGAFRIGPLRRGPGSIVAHIEVGRDEELARVQEVLTGACDFWIIDQRFGKMLRSEAGAPQFTYDDEAVIGQAIADALQMFGNKRGRIATCGANESVRAAIASMAPVQSGNAVDVLVACSASEPAGVTEIAQVREGGAVLVVRSRSLTHAALALARQRGLRLWRVECGASLIAMVERLLATHDRYHRASGELELAEDTHIVAAGVVGQAGDLVVDSKIHPRFILGVADGSGGVRPLDHSDADRSRRVQQWMVGQWGL